MSTKNTIKLLQNETLLTNQTAFLILLVTPVLWKCFKVPIEDRAYLRDQRLKKGRKGLYQMASVDRVAVK